MDQVHVIRHKVRVEGLSVRRVARQMGVSRNTVKRYLGDGVLVGQRAATARAHPVRDVVQPRIEALLAAAPGWTAGKQRLTAARVHTMLREQGICVGETVVKEVVREQRRRRQEVFVPLVYRPGDLGEVDFFEVLVDVAGERRKAWMFVMRLMHSGRDFAWLYPRQDQVCFLDGHVRAFGHLGGAPHRLIYDNLKPAVRRILVGAEREVAPRLLALATHYVFEPCFARPATGHDKGGVEARGKGIRWQELVPIPTGRDLAEISGALLGRLDGRMAERRNEEGRTVAERFVEEQAQMLPLPPRPFQAAAPRLTDASASALVRVAGGRYSVWSEWARQPVTAYVGVDEVEVVGPDKRRVRHPRCAFGGKAIDYRHYVPVLAKKPQAVRQVAPELVRDLGEPYGTLWRRVVDEQGPRQASRVMASVLDAIVELGALTVEERVRQALATDVPVLLALRPPAPAPAALAQEALPSGLQGLEVPSARAAEYDELLSGGAW